MKRAKTRVESGGEGAGGKPAHTGTFAALSYSSHRIEPRVSAGQELTK